jgi:hypothetical protein
MPTGIAPPRRFKPPTTSTADRSADRSPRDGYAGTITFGEITAGTGSFIRYAKALGMQCRWFSEMDSDLHAAAAKEAGAEAQVFGDLLLPPLEAEGRAAHERRFSGSVDHQWWKVLPRRSRGQTRTTRGYSDPPQGHLARPVLVPVC